MKWCWLNIELIYCTVDSIVLKMDYRIWVLKPWSINDAFHRNDDTRGEVGIWILNLLVNQMKKKH